MESFKKSLIALCFLTASLASAQYANSESLKQLDKLISEKKHTEAKRYLKESIDIFKAKKDYYLLTDYIYYTGKINLQLYDKKRANTSVQDYIESLTSATDSAKVLRQIKLELATYYELVGETQKAYNSNLEALQITKNWNEATPEHLGLIENNLCVLLTRKGDIANAIKHGNNALKHYESYPKTNKTNLYVLYSTMGGSMWYEAKIDSALYFYQKAEKTLKLMEPNPTNSFYRPAILNNNISAIYSTQGNLEKALDAMKFTVNNLNQYIASDVADSKKENGYEFLFMSIENFAGIYKDIGNLEKAKELLEYSYNAKKKHFDSESPELYKAKILLGQIHLALKDYNQAKTFLDDGLSHIERTESGNNFWAADGHSYKARLHEELGDISLAKQHYENAENLYQAALQGAYDNIYLDFIINASHFYAKNNDEEKALAMAQKAYEYIKENQGSTTAFEIQQALNLGEIHYELGNYNAALINAETTEELLKKMLPTQTNPLDSTKIILYKPQTILLKSRSEYKLNGKNNSIADLKMQFKTLKEAISIVEKQKTYLGDDTSVSLLIERNSDLFEFTKQLALDLYETTKDKAYLLEVISMHESILYNKIRAQLNSRTSMTYANIPSDVLEQEKIIKNAIQESLGKSDNLEAYIKANSQWKTHLETLKKDYPKYYNLRFASIAKSLKDIETKLPENTSIVRYIYVDEELYANLISKSGIEIFKLHPEGLNSKITSLQDENALFQNSFNLSHELYQQLWKPFEQYIKTKKVVIIPDRDLFNLNFEMLTNKELSDPKELATHSLLSQYTISYNYSLFLINNGSHSVLYNNNFVAFVPEFNDQMKSDYLLSIKDSLNIDKTYLTLLPQPFTKDLANLSTRLFKGTSFLNENSTEHIFKNSAKEHKIIHIGTHAESNNISPELSRLVFAKSMDSTNTDDNYLYTYEIYNTNLSSNLAILTACETGKPTYQAGEGMISLAHAFNYAGSESMLTSLWKIDEQSSAQIIQSFYRYIKKGLPKDEALQKAKLDYITTAKGRTTAPQYWAGLVLIGDTSPIALKSTPNLAFWLSIITVFLILIMVVFKKKFKKTNS
ncbi:CHAT domain-containing protein [Psychroserpens algicola]|uniref:CHAT domain-containing protein n=1 Tax=Psychroserpens algicola TaxID=1719034 RepID=A0ABT0H3Z8_9FLAO|nr:CHAT domain-containing tetratricopeptide repeat protein [Psychroserpens algicola]MCK8479105.1 CHAT domain-containing protein [Psychroserpens algicola]